MHIKEAFNTWLQYYEEFELIFVEYKKLNSEATRAFTDGSAVAGKNPSIEILNLEIDKIQKRMDSVINQIRNT
jgi:hypothetical protein